MLSEGSPAMCFAHAQQWSRSDPAVSFADPLCHTVMSPQEAVVLPNDGGAMFIPGGGGTPASSGAGSMLPPPARFPAGRTPGGGPGSVGLHWTGPSWPAARSVGGGGHSLGSPSLFGRSVDMVDLAVQLMGDAGAPAPMSLHTSRCHPFASCTSSVVLFDLLLWQGRVSWWRQLAAPPS